jgi:hypothetical protein
MKGLKPWPNTYFERRRPVLDLNAAIRERHSTRMFLLQVGWNLSPPFPNLFWDCLGSALPRLRDFPI